MGKLYCFYGLNFRCVNRNKNKSWNQNSKKNSLTKKLVQLMLSYSRVLYIYWLSNEYANLFRICLLHTDWYRGILGQVFWDNCSSKDRGRCRNRDPHIRTCRGSEFWPELQSVVRSIEESKTTMRPFLLLKIWKKQIFAKY